MKTIKEKQMFVKWAKAMNQPVDTSLLEEVEKYEKIQKEILESVRGNAFYDLVEASAALFGSRATGLFDRIFRF